MHSRTHVKQEERTRNVHCRVVRWRAHFASHHHWISFIIIVRIYIFHYYYTNYARKEEDGQGTQFPDDTSIEAMQHVLREGPPLPS